jgi:uncharacterized membrane protein
VNFSIRKKRINLCLIALLVVSLSSITLTTSAQPPVGLTNESNSQWLIPDFYMYSSPVSLTVPIGSSQNASIGVASLAGFNGTVSLSLSVPTELTSANLVLQQLSIKSGQLNATKLMVEVPSSAAARSYTIKVNGTSGALSHCSYVVVNVVKPDFSLYASPSYMSIGVGTSQNSTLRLSSLYGWNGTVALSASTPSGIELSPLTSSIDVKSRQPNTVAMKVTVPSTSLARTYTITITASSGSLTHSTNLTVCAFSPDFTIYANPNCLSVPVGTSTNTTVRISSQWRYNGTIALSANAPEGWTAPTFLANPLSVNSTANNATTLTVFVPSTAKAGTYIVKVLGTDGVLTHYTNVTVRTNVPDFAISANPSYIYVPLGTTANTTIRLTARNYFNGTVTLSTNTPTSVVPNLQSSSLKINLTNNSTILSISVSPDTPTGTYILKVSGTSGALTHYCNVSVCVTKPDFSISALPPMITNPMGTHAGATIIVKSLNKYNGTISLSATAPIGWSAPTLMTSALTVKSAISNSTALVVTIPSTATAGNYTIAVTGTSGTLTHTANLTIKITA